MEGNQNETRGTHLRLHPAGLGGLAGDQVKGRIGFDAQQIADTLDILRNNVSKELNELHRRGKIVKFSGRPVLYFDKACLESVLGVELGEGACQFDDVEAISQSKAPAEPENPLCAAHRCG